MASLDYLTSKCSLCAAGYLLFLLLLLLFHFGSSFRQYIFELQYLKSIACCSSHVSLSLSLLSERFCAFMLSRDQSFIWIL